MDLDGVGVRQRSYNSMQRTALYAAPDAERSAVL